MRQQRKALVAIHGKIYSLMQDVVRVGIVGFPGTEEL